MLEQTRAIAISYIRYKDTSIIARFFTESFGLQAFVVNGVRSAKSKLPLGLFQPLALSELIQYVDERKDLHRFKEIRMEKPLADLPFSPAKASMALFVAEFLGKVLKEGLPNPALFEQTREWILELDQARSQYENAHLQFLWKSLEPLGLQPAEYLDLIPPGTQLQATQEADFRRFFSELDLHGRVPDDASGGLKQWVLDVLLYYYQNHLEGMGHLQSLTVLRQVFSA